MKKVFISIINFNGEKNTLECLKSIDNLNMKGMDLNVVVIDNASKEKLHLKLNFLPFDQRLLFLQPFYSSFF